MTEQETRVEKRLEAARRDIMGWRAGRAKLGPMPAQLWAEAIALSSEVGVSRVSRALEMNHGALSRRVEPARAMKSERIEFVEVSSEAPAAKTLRTVIKLTSASGNRLMVRLSGPVDVGLLLRQFQATQ